MGDDKAILEQRSQQLELQIKDLECRLKTQEAMAESSKLEVSSLGQINEENIAQITRLEVEASAMDKDKVILEERNQQMELSKKDLECRLKTQEAMAESINGRASSLGLINEENIAQIARLEVEASAIGDDKAILE